MNSIHYTMDYNLTRIPEQPHSQRTAIVMTTITGTRIPVGFTGYKLSARKFLTASTRLSLQTHTEVELESIQVLGMQCLPTFRIEAPRLLVTTCVRATHSQPALIVNDEEVKFINREVIGVTKVRPEQSRQEF